MCTGRYIKTNVFGRLAHNLPYAIEVVSVASVKVITITAQFELIRVVPCYLHLNKIVCGEPLIP